MNLVGISFTLSEDMPDLDSAEEEEVRRGDVPTGLRQDRKTLK